MRIVIIGAGLLGVTTAYFLGKYGHDVTVVDRCPGPALETSFANGGMLTPSQSGPWNTPGITSRVLKWLGRDGSPILVKPGALFSLIGWGTAFISQSSEDNFRVNLQKNSRLTEYSLAILQQLRRESGIHYDESLTGTMKIFRDPDSLAYTLGLYDSFEHGSARHEVLDQSGVIEHEPALSAGRGNIAGGIFYPEDEAGDAYRFCCQLAESAAGNGVRFRYSEDVSGLVRSGNEIKFINTSSGKIEADVYILSAGSYSPILARTAGLSLPIRPVKGYSLTFDADSGLSGPGMPIIDESRHIAVTPLGRKIRISGTAELGGYDTSIANNRINRMYRFYSELYPEYREISDRSRVNTWAGLRPYTCDGVPILGQCEIRNLYMNTGHGHLGWSMSAGSGKLLADLIDQGKADLDLRPYELARFI